MLKYIRVYGLKLLTVVLIGVLLFAFAFGNPLVLWNNYRLEKQILAATEETVVLNQLTPFDWDAVYTFSPYTSRTEIAQCIGFSSADIKETVSEGMTQLLFVEDQRIVCSVCGYPDGLGYGVSGLPVRQEILNQADAPKFYLERRGDTIWLQYLP